MCAGRASLFEQQRCFASSQPAVRAVAELLRSSFVHLHTGCDIGLCWYAVSVAVLPWLLSQAVNKGIGTVGAKAPILLATGRRGVSQVHLVT